jgi:hypothetical protein
MIEAIEYLKGCGWTITLFDIGDKRPCLVLAVKCLPHEMWYLGRQCLEDGLEMGAAMYSPRDGVAYFPALEVDADSYRVIMS